MKTAFFASAVVCALVVPAAAQPSNGLPFRTAGFPEITISLRHQVTSQWRDIVIHTDGSVTGTSYAGSSFGRPVGHPVAANLTAAEVGQIENDVIAAKANLASLPARLPYGHGLIMGDRLFTITVKTSDGKTYTTQGQLDNFNGFGAFKALLDAAVAVTDRVSPQGGSVPVDPNPPKAPDPASSDWKGIRLDLRSQLADGNSSLQINADGSYDYYPPLTRAPQHGQLTADQLAAVKRAYASADFASLPATMPGILPDTTMFTLTANGKTVSGYTNGSVTAPGNAAWAALSPLLGSLEGISNRLDPTPPIARPIDTTTKKGSEGFGLGSIGEFFTGVGRTVAGWFGGGSKSAPAAKPADANGDAVRGPRTAGMTSLLDGRVGEGVDSGRSAADR